jgi:hypothetical protein
VEAYERLLAYDEVFFLRSFLDLGVPIYQECKMASRVMKNKHF